MTKYCDSCHTSNRDRANYCRGCAGKFVGLDLHDGAYASTSRDAIEPPRSMPPALGAPRAVAQARGRPAAPRRGGWIPVPHGVDGSIVWLLIVLAGLHGAFILWYLNRPSPRAELSARREALVKAPAVSTDCAPPPSAGVPAPTPSPALVVARAPIPVAEVAKPVEAPPPVFAESRSSPETPSVLQPPTVAAQEAPPHQRSPPAREARRMRPNPSRDWQPHAERATPAHARELPIFLGTPSGRSRARETPPSPVFEPPMRGESARMAPVTALRVPVIAAKPAVEDARPAWRAPAGPPVAARPEQRNPAPCDVYNPYGEVPCGSSGPQGRVARVPNATAVAARIGSTMASAVSALGISKGTSTASGVASADLGGSGASASASAGGAGAGGGPGR